MPDINIHDFSYFQRGIAVAGLNTEDRVKIASIALDTGKRNKALLLLHGFSSTPNTFKSLIENLKPHYDAIYAPLLPKHGLDLASFSTLTGAELLEFAKNTAQSLTASFKQVDVIGLSLGGLLAHHISICCAISNLYLMAPAFSLHLPVNASIYLSYLLINTGFTFLPAKAGNVYTDAYELAYRLLPIKTIQEILVLIKNYPFTLPNCPTTVLLGRHDAVVQSLAVEQLFKESNCSIIWLENSAHLLPIDGDQKAIIQLLS